MSMKLHSDTWALAGLG